MEVIDTHSHLEDIGDLGAAIARAKAAGVIGIIAVGMDYQSNMKALQIAADFPGYVFPALGLHPWSLGTDTEGVLESIEKNIDKAVAVGEVGLDYHKQVTAGAAKDRQKAALEDVLSLAKKYGKPVILHSRYAWKDCFALTARSGIEMAVFHWYTGPTSVLAQIVEAGYMISVTPAAEYHPEHRRAVKAAPPDKLLLETDTPVTYGTGQRWQAEPADVARSLKAAAELRGASQEELADMTTANAVRFFKLPLKSKGGT